MSLLLKSIYAITRKLKALFSPLSTMSMASAASSVEQELETSDSLFDSFSSSVMEGSRVYLDNAALWPRGNKAIPAPALIRMAYLFAYLYAYYVSLLRSAGFEDAIISQIEEGLDAGAKAAQQTYQNIEILTPPRS